MNTELKVLLLGSGGRENALAWKISGSPLLGKLYCMPGNPGMAPMAVCLEGKPTDFPKVCGYVTEYGIDMVVVGPEDPLVLGLKDYLAACPETSHVMFVGPDKAGAQLEGSKDYAKGFMARHGIPTAAYRTFGAEELPQAVAFLDSLEPPYVLKADGLAAGKGVLIIEGRNEAVKELEAMFSGKFGAAGDKVVIEQFLSGIECSVFVLTDGKDYMILPQAKDYKRIMDGDRGLNTGGMGSVSPVPFADKVFMTKVEERIVKPTVAALAEEGMDYRGFIFIGLMNCGGEPYVIEYNVRMGDPETEAVMPRIESDLLSHLKAAASGDLKGECLKVSEKTSLAVMAVSGGYPGSYQKGKVISGLDSLEGVTVFHSGTAVSAEGDTVTAGGRVLAVVALEDDLQSAIDKVYSLMDSISFEGMFYRHDIGADVAKYL